MPSHYLNLSWLIVTRIPGNKILVTLELIYNNCHWRNDFQNVVYKMVANLSQHYNDVIMGAIAYQITSLTIVHSIVYSDADQRKHQSSASLAFVWEIHRGPVNSPHKWPVTRKIFPFDDVIMSLSVCTTFYRNPDKVFLYDWFSISVNCVPETDHLMDSNSTEETKCKNNFPNVMEIWQPLFLNKSTCILL